MPMFAGRFAWFVLFLVLTMIASESSTSMAANRPPKAAQANVISIKAVIDHSSYAATGGVDVVTAVLRNDSKQKYVKVSLVPFRNYRETAVPMVMMISAPVIHVPKPNDDWLFRLKRWQTKEVIFVIRHTGADSYCIRSRQSGLGLYTLCSK